MPDSKINFTQTVSEDAPGDETVKLIVKTINTYSNDPFVKETVKILSKGNPDKTEFLKRVFGVACKNVTYLADQPGHEVIYTPLLLMRMGKGDCKKFTVFIASVLKAAGIDAVPKVVKYQSGNDWEHIYVISRDGDRYITLDPVNHEQFDKEVNYNKARLNYLDGSYSTVMNGNKLSLMGNLGDESNGLINGLGCASNNVLGDLEVIGRRKSGGGGSKRAERKEAKAENPKPRRKEKKQIEPLPGDEPNTPSTCATSSYEPETIEGLREDYINGLEDENVINGIGDIGRKTKEQRQVRRKKIFKAAAKVSMVPTRAAFLGIIALGRALEHTKLKMNLAAKLAKSWQSDNGAKIMKIWEAFGGDRKTIAKAISKAAHVKISGISGVGDAEETRIEGLEGIGVYTAAAAAAAITAATPIVLGVMKMLKKDKVVTPEESARTAQYTETLEQAANVVDGGLKPEAVRELAQSTIVKYGAGLDQGGNQEAQQQIKKDNVTDFNTSQPQAQQVETVTAPRTTQAASDSATNQQTESTINPQLLPVPQAAAKSMFGSIMLPTVWVRICILIMLVGHYDINQNLLKFLGGIALGILFITSIHLFTNQKKIHNER